MAVVMKGFMELMHELIEKLAAQQDPGISESLTARAKIYAARIRLQHVVDQADGLDAIREIAANLIGCEQLAVYKVDHSAAALWLYWSFGIDPNQYAVLDAVKNPNLKEVLTGSIVFAAGDRSRNLLAVEDHVSAIVPIIVSDAVVAVIVLFRLLPQKTAFDVADRELCRVLSGSAGRAITPPATKLTKGNSSARE